MVCQQAGEEKLNCRKRNLVYESKCNECNPEREKARDSLEDKRDAASIYVGETARSVAERSKEHWEDFTSNKEDSHMRKHWLEKHGGEGKPNFRFEIVRFYKDALSRQVGEAIRTTKVCLCVTQSILSYIVCPCLCRCSLGRFWVRSIVGSICSPGDVYSPVDAHLAPLWAMDGVLSVVVYVELSFILA